MSGDVWPATIGILGALILVGGGLLRQRLPRHRAIVLVAIWIAIIGGTWAAVMFGLRG